METCPECIALLLINTARGSVGVQIVFVFAVLFVCPAES